MKILAVDDEPLIRRLLETTLVGLGYSDNTFAADGAEALKCLNAASEPFDCILLDIEMPNLNGIDFLKQLRKVPTYRSTPVIMLTAMSEKSYIDESFANGATDYLTKPLDATDLSARLRVARLLCEANAGEKAQSERSAMPAAEVFDFSDAIRIEDVPRVVQSLAMENYLLQLGRLGLFKLGAIGFKIRNAGPLFAREGCEEFREILTDVADCIFEATRAVNPLISYLGSGSFIAIVPRNANFSGEELEDLITTHLISYRPEEDLNAENEIRVLVGEQVNGSLFGSSPLKIIDQAFEAVQKRQSQLPQRLTSRLMAI